MVDERGGLPSASGMERLFPPDGCIGSFLMEKHLADLGSRAAAKRGEKIHAVMDGSVAMEALSHSDKLCAERMMFEEGRLVEELGFEGATQFKEKRLWFKAGGEMIFSGKPDVIHVLSRRVLIINYKTGFYAPTPIEKNRQMLCEAILVAHASSYLFDSVSVALIHPQVDIEGRISQHHTFDISHICMVAPVFEMIATDAMNEDAPRSPSEKNCRFCKGQKNSMCPEFLASGLTFTSGYKKRNI
jgi:hypothetical protein